MASVTVPGTGGSTVTIPPSTNASFIVAKNIADAIAAAGGKLDITQGVFGGTIPWPPAGKVGEVVLSGDAGGGATIPAGYSFIVNNANAPVTITAGNNQSLITGGKGTSVFGSGNNTIAASGGSNLVVLNGGSTFLVGGGEGNDTVFATGSGTQAGGGGANLLWGADPDTGSKQLFISNGSNDTVVAGAGTSTITNFGSSSLVFGGSGQLVVGGSIDNETVAAGAGSATIFGANSGVYFLQSSKTVFVDEGGSNTIVGGTGSTTIFGGAGQNLIFGDGGPIQFVGSAGTAGTNVTFFGSANSGGGSFAAYAGNETLNAGGSQSSNLFSAGTGSDRMIGGSGSDTMFAGTGSATMTGGAGGDFFTFIKGAAGGSDVITDFNSNDSLILVGYSAASVSAAIGTAGSGSTLTLSDNTKITFQNVSVSSITGNIHSF
jgi:Ca2+-binding RTX toxin-like protein